MIQICAVCGKVGQMGDADWKGRDENRYCPIHDEESYSMRCEYSESCEFAERCYHAKPHPENITCKDECKTAGGVCREARS